MLYVKKTYLTNIAALEDSVRFRFLQSNQKLVFLLVNNCGLLKENLIYLYNLLKKRTKNLHHLFYALCKRFFLQVPEKIDFSFLIYGLISLYTGIDFFTIFRDLLVVFMMLEKLIFLK